MTDTEMLDWIQEHLDGFRHSMRDDDQSPYELSWIDDEGVGQVTIGNDLRDCIDHAVRPHKSCYDKSDRKHDWDNTGWQPQ